MYSCNKQLYIHTTIQRSNKRQSNIAIVISDVKLSLKAQSNCWLGI